MLQCSCRLQHFYYCCFGYLEQESGVSACCMCRLHTSLQCFYNCCFGYTLEQEHGVSACCMCPLHCTCPLTFTPFCSLSSKLDRMLHLSPLYPFTMDVYMAVMAVMADGGWRMADGGWHIARGRTARIARAPRTPPTL